MENQTKPAPRGSTVIAFCWLCNAPARLVCMTCQNGWCKEHLNERARCVHNRHNHAELRLLDSTGWVTVDTVIYFPTS